MHDVFYNGIYRAFEFATIIFFVVGGLAWIGRLARRMFFT